MHMGAPANNTDSARPEQRVPRPKVGIVGTGIAGLGAAHRLHRHADLTLFDAADWVGGHSHTVDATVDGVTVPVDTGFIVYNERTYPLLTRLFTELGVETEASDMSFAVVGDLEYEGSAAGLFSDRRTILRPSHYGMIRDITSFNVAARRAVRLGLSDEVSLGQFTAGYGTAFREQYLLPMGAAIWSTSAADMTSYPAAAFLRFFSNHGLLDLRDRPQWRTVTGGSREYVTRMIEPFADRIRLRTPVAGVRRSPDGVIVSTTARAHERFDYLIMACHADTSLRLLGDHASAKERQTLGTFRYSQNRAVLHTDATFMPRSRRTWASWNVSAHRPDGPPSVTYWMNRLQNLSTPMPLLVTLNPDREPTGMLGAWHYDHPLFDLSALRAQEDLPEIQASDLIAFAGAFMRNGFHEDGLSSGYQAAEALLRAIEQRDKSTPRFDRVVA